MVWSILLVVLLSACASIEPIPFKGPSGNPGYSMQCSGMGRTLQDCYQKAGELCPGGYTIIDRATSVVGLPMRGGTMIAPQHSLAIECSASLASSDSSSSGKTHSKLEVSVMPVLMPPAISAPVHRLAVIPLSDETNPRVSSSLDLTLNFLRARHPQMVIVERERLNPVLDEITLQYNGSVSDDSIVRLGRLTGADTLLTYRLEPLTQDSIAAIAVNGGTLSGTAEFRLLDIETGTTLFRQGVTGQIVMLFPGQKRAYQPDGIRQMHRFVTSHAASYALAALAAAFGDNPLGLVPNVAASEGGVEVIDVLQGGPAHAAGLRRHDLIVAINGSPFRNWLMPLSLPATLSIQREGRTQEISINNQ